MSHIRPYAHVLPGCTLICCQTLLSLDYPGCVVSLGDGHAVMSRSRETSSRGTPANRYSTANVSRSMCKCARFGSPSEFTNNCGNNSRAFSVIFANIFSSWKPRSYVYCGHSKKNSLDV